MLEDGDWPYNFWKVWKNTLLDHVSIRVDLLQYQADGVSLPPDIQDHLPSEGSKGRFGRSFFEHQLNFIGGLFLSSTGKITWLSSTVIHLTTSFDF